MRDAVCQPGRLRPPSRRSRHRPRVRRIVRDEGDRLDGPDVRHDLNEACVDDVGVLGRLGVVRRPLVAEDETVRAARPGIEVLVPG